MQKAWVSREIIRLLLCFLLLSVGSLSQTGLAQDATVEVVTTTMTFGDWRVRCETTTDKPKSCVMTQQIFEQQTGQEFVQANFAKTADGVLMTLITPLGLYLPPGIELEVVDHDKRVFPITFCRANGCFVNQILDDDFIDLLRKKESATITIYGRINQPLVVPFSIVGFLDAYKQL